MGSLNHKPISTSFGYDRGTPIDRYYIENFLMQNKSLIYGDVLEVADNNYTKKFGQNITKSEVLNLSPSPKATIVGNLETGENIPQSAFDCIILTQVIHVLYDVRAALKNTINALKKEGTLLLTTAGISQNCSSSFHGDYWRFTNESLRKLLLEIVPKNAVTIEVFGNVGVAKAFLDGYALHEIPKKILDYKDHNYQLVLTSKVKRISE